MSQRVDWPLVRLDAVADVRLGKMLSPKAKDATLQQLPYLRNENVRWGRIDTLDLKTMGFKPSELERYSVKAGDLLVCEGGEPGRCAIYDGQAGPLMYQKALHRVRCGEAVSPRFLAYWFQAFVRSRSVTGRISQTTIAHLPLEEIRALEIPLPSREAQDAIVSEIEKHFTRLDAGIADLNQSFARHPAYVATLLTAAASGQLGSHRGLASSGDRLRGALKAAVAEQWTGSPPKVIASDGAVPFAIPESWTWMPVGDLLRQRPSNGLSIKAADGDEGVTALRLNAMSDSGFDYRMVRVLPIAWERVQDLAVEEGDFFVSRGNGSLHLVARGTLAQAPPKPVIYPDTMIRLRFVRGYGIAEWVAAIWRAPFVRRQIEQRVKTTAGIWKIAQPELQSVMVPIPPLEQQTSILASVSRGREALSIAAQVCTINLQRAERLRRAILAAAFSGRLGIAGDLVCER